MMSKLGFCEMRSALNHRPHDLIEVVRWASLVQFTANSLVQCSFVDVTILISYSRKVTIPIVYTLFVLD